MCTRRFKYAAAYLHPRAGTLTHLGRMKLLVDENLSTRVASTLRDAGHDAVLVNAVGLANTDDDVILRSAADDGRIIVTADADFGALLALRGDRRPSVLMLRSSDRLTPRSAGGPDPRHAGTSRERLRRRGCRQRDPRAHPRADASHHRRLSPEQPDRADQSRSRQVFRHRLPPTMGRDRCSSAGVVRRGLGTDPAPLAWLGRRLRGRTRA